MILETERTFLRKFQVDDADKVLKIYSNPNVMKFIGDGHPYSLNQTKIFIGKMIKRYERDGYSFWLIIDKSNNECIGHGGFLYKEDLKLPEIGYTICEELWRKGFAYEVSKAVIRYGFTKMNFDTIVAITKHVNAPSKKLMIKLGMIYWDGHECNTKLHIIYKMEKADYIK